MPIKWIPQERSLVCVTKWLPMERSVLCAVRAPRSAIPRSHGVGLRDPHADLPTRGVGLRESQPDPAAWGCGNQHGSRGPAAWGRGNRPRIPRPRGVGLQDPQPDPAAPRRGAARSEAGSRRPRGRGIASALPGQGRRASPARARPKTAGRCSSLGLSRRPARVFKSYFKGAGAPERPEREPPEVVEYLAAGQSLHVSVPM